MLQEVLLVGAVVAEEIQMVVLQQAMEVVAEVVVVVLLVDQLYAFGGLVAAGVCQIHRGRQVEQGRRARR